VETIPGKNQASKTSCKEEAGDNDEEIIH